MTLRVPTAKASQSAAPAVVEEGDGLALTTLRGRAKVRRTMWSRRAQEYEAKINSGDPVSIAEVVRDLHRGGAARAVLLRAPNLPVGAGSPDP